MLGLKLPTDPRWVNIAEKNIEDILADHAWCEQKAASSGISLIVRYSDCKRLVDEVSPVVAEEWGHFRKVLREMEKRGCDLNLKRKDEYVVKLTQVKRNGGSRMEQLIEELLVFALIEARSCERFRLLSLQIADPKLKDFYHEFMVSEAGHYTMFLELANHYMPTEYVKKRWEEYLIAEAEIIKNLEVRGDRMH